MDDFVTAIGLVLVIEGATYAVAPEAMQRAMAAIQQASPQTLRTAGPVAAVAGLGLVWLIRG